MRNSCLPQHATDHPCLARMSQRKLLMSAAVGGGSCFTGLICNQNLSHSCKHDETGSDCRLAVNSTRISQNHPKKEGCRKASLFLSLWIDNLSPASGEALDGTIRINLFFLIHRFICCFGSYGQVFHTGAPVPPAWRGARSSPPAGTSSHPRQRRWPSWR